MDPDRAVLVIIDVQERLAAAMPERARDQAVRNMERLIGGARELSIPVLATEQYPKGLGPTVAPLAEALAAVGTRPVEKLTFDACENPELSGALESLGRDTVVVAGMEAHVCVWRTVRSLCARGAAVHVPADATCSRELDNRRIAEGLWARAGAVVTCTETVLFDLVPRAGTPTFKALARLVR